MEILGWPMGWVKSPLRVAGSSHPLHPIRRGRDLDGLTRRPGYKTTQESPQRFWRQTEVWDKWPEISRSLGGVGWGEQRTPFHAWPLPVWHGPGGAPEPIASGEWGQLYKVTPVVQTGKEVQRRDKTTRRQTGDSSNATRRADPWPREPLGPAHLLSGAPAERQERSVPTLHVDFSRSPSPT